MKLIHNNFCSRAKYDWIWTAFMVIRITIYLRSKKIVMRGSSQNCGETTRCFWTQFNPDEPWMAKPVWSVERRWRPNAVNINQTKCFRLKFPITSLKRSRKLQAFNFPDNKIFHLTLIDFRRKIYFKWCAKTQHRIKNRFIQLCGIEISEFNVGERKEGKGKFRSNKLHKIWEQDLCDQQKSLKKQSLHLSNGHS